jgi:predicted small lipoprotein YifL
MKRFLLVLAVGAALAGCSRQQTPSSLPPTAVNAKNFVVLGDWGAGLDSSDRVADRLCKWRKKHPFDLVLTTGDNIYPSGSASDFEDNFFDPFSCLLDHGVRWRSALGNHDVITDNGQPELDEPAFGMKARN